MIKTISKIGNSQGIILDAALMELAHLKPGDQVNLTVHEGGSITLTPTHPRATPGEFKRTLKGVLKDYKNTLKKLA